MPYTIDKPPDAIKALPKQGRETWIAAFNSAIAESPDDEKQASAVAWAAVKKSYEQDKEGVWRLKADVTLSLDRIRDMLWNAVHERFKPAGGNETSNAYVREVFPGYLIYEKDGKLYRVGWSLLDGEVTLGEAHVEVEQQWVETRSQQAESDEGAELLMRLGAARDPEGKAWDVTICEPGFTKNGWFIPDEALRDAAGLFEGVDVNLYELPQGATHLPDPLFDLKSLLVKNKVGWIDGVKHAAGLGLQGVLHFIDSAQQLGKNLLSAMKDGKAIYGLSYDCPVRAKKDVVEGKPVFKVVKFMAADSVDIVTRPAAGGKFNRAVASLPAQIEEAQTMKKSLWDLISKVRPDLLKGKVFDTITDQEVETIARMAQEPAPGGDPTDTKTAQEVAALKNDIAVMRCGMALDSGLAASDLPEISRKRIQGSFAGKVFKEEDLARAIADEKDYLAKVNARPENEPVRASGIAVGLGTYERACMAVDRLFGLSAADLTALAAHRRLDNQPFFQDVRSTQDIADYDKIPAFAGLREMYHFFTGDPEVSGRFDRRNLPAELRSRMDVNSATFTYVLGNTLGRRLVAMYKDYKYREELLISIRKPVKDFRTQEAVLVGGFGDVATVDPETGDYAEITGVTDEESTYTLGQKGNLLTITRKTIINDDISIVQRLLAGLARALRRTHAKYVWDFFISNSNCSDGTAWFTSGHGNLGATALSHATALIAYLALAEMTEKDSGEPLGLLDDPDVKPALVGPMDLMSTIEQIANEESYYSSNDLTTKTPNPLKGKVIPVPFSLLTDANDWGLILPPNVADCVEMGYLNGRQEPEFFVADAPQAEQVFVADKIRHKVRHEYAGAMIDYRTGYKAEVT